MGTEEEVGVDVIVERVRPKKVKFGKRDEWKRVEKSLGATVSDGCLSGPETV